MTQSVLFFTEENLDLFFSLMFSGVQEDQLYTSNRGRCNTLLCG